MNSGGLFGDERDPWSLPSPRNNWAGPTLHDDVEGLTLGSNQEIDEMQVPQSYKERFIAVQINNYVPRVSIDSLLQQYIDDQFQRTRLVEVFGANDLDTAIDKTKFYMIMGLIALEAQNEGNGSIAMLEKYRANLPDLTHNTHPSAAMNDPLARSITSSPFVSNSIHEPPTTDNIWGDNGSGLSPPLTASLSGSIAIEHNETPRISVPDDPLSAQKPMSGSVYNTVDENKMDEPEMIQWLNQTRDKFNPLADDVVAIREIPEKEGLVFKHINYLVSHNIMIEGDSSIKKVIRRYSEFAWLLEILLKKYPFRVIPGLPPKKFAGASPDSQFLQRRRRGLSRFLNQLVKHPVLSKEPLVITFLTVPTDLSTWKKQAKIDLSIEFSGKKISKRFISNWNPIFMERFKLCEAEMRALIDYWSKTCILIERYERREQQIALDNQRFGDILKGFSTSNQKLFPIETSDISSVNSHLARISLHLNKEADLLNEEAGELNLRVLEFFKNFLDYLFALNDLFERVNRLGGNNIEYLTKRITETENRLAKLSTQPDIKGSEISKLKNLIIQDKQEIFNQMNRDWLIKEVIFNEFVMFQETQYLISKNFQQWSASRLKYADLHQEGINGLALELQEMPLSRI